LLEADRGRKPGRPRPHDHHVIGHRLARRRHSIPLRSGAVPTSRRKQPTLGR
jgi:hypothetical protein